MLQILDRELHLHLFGCITPEDLWEAAQKNHGTPLLRWYEDEFKIAYGRQPQLSSYFGDSKEQAIQAITNDFVCQSKRHFTQFQASFNLAIALFPNRFDDAQLLQTVAQRQKSSGIHYSEYRLVLPPRLTRHEQKAYLTLMANCANQINKRSKQCKLILTLFRHSPTLHEDYQLIKEWQTEHTDLSQEFVALDFCMDEQACPPILLEKFIEQVRKDNQAAPHQALDIAYHVGESYDRIGLGIACSWIAQSCDLGLRRLGHAAAAGITPVKSAHLQALQVSGFILKAHLNYCLDVWDELQNYDFPLTRPFVNKLRDEIKNDHTSFSWPPIEQALEVTQAWQYFARQKLLQSGAIVECCPTSHVVLGEIDDYSNHPLIQLHKSGIKCIVSSDDPGIFASNLKNEEKILRQKTDLDEHDLQKLQQNTLQLESLTLT